jgi:hypothetical protein
MSNEINRVVDYWAFYTFEKCGQRIPLEDLKQDYWILAIEAKKEWNPNKASLSSFVFKRLQWASSNRVKQTWNTNRLMNSYLASTTELLCDPIEESYDSLCFRIANKLKPKLRKTFLTIAYPSEELTSLSYTREGEFTEKSRKRTEMKQKNVAKYLGINTFSYTKQLQEIRKVVKRELTH